MVLFAVSDAVWNTLIGAFVVLIPIWLDYRSKQRTIALTKSLDETKENVKTIEVATNSMKDALVAATKTAGELQGRADERAEQQARTDAPTVAPPTIESNVSTLTKDVKEVKRDVKTVKAEVTKDQHG